MCTSIVSALTKKPVHRNLAMTGEITLRGRVLPIGGIKEKILAAHRGGMQKVLRPRENEKDLKDIPSYIMKQMDLVFVDHMDEVLAHAIIGEPEKPVFAVDDVNLEVIHMDDGVHQPAISTLIQ
jgi:ATP-dependent Lon protease